MRVKRGDGRRHLPLLRTNRQSEDCWNEANLIQHASSTNSMGNKGAKAGTHECVRSGKSLQRTVSAGARLPDAGQASAREGAPGRVPTPLRLAEPWAGRGHFSILGAAPPEATRDVRSLHSRVFPCARLMHRPLSHL